MRRGSIQSLEQESRMWITSVDHECGSRVVSCPPRTRRVVRRANRCMMVKFHSVPQAALSLFAPLHDSSLLMRWPGACALRVAEVVPWPMRQRKV